MREIRTVLLTHWHTDHTGGLAALRTASGARVVAHALDAPVISGDEPDPGTGLMRLTALLLDRSGGVLLAGDAVGNRRGRLGGSPRPLTADRAAAATSVAKLASLRFEVAVFGHGAPLTERAVDRFRELAVRIS